MKTLLVLSGISLIAVSTLGCQPDDPRREAEDVERNIDEPEPSPESNLPGQEPWSRLQLAIPEAAPPVWDVCSGQDVGPLAAGGSGYLEIGAERLGDPMWAPADFQLFRGPMGTAKTGFKEMHELMGQLMPSHGIDALGFSFPREAHIRPFEAELTVGLAELGIESDSVYPQTAWEAPNGLFIAFLALPTKCADRGVTADLDKAHIIHDDDLPLRTRVAIFDADHNVVSDDLSWEIPPSFKVLPAEVESDGYSHVPVIVPLNTDVLEEARPGEYTALVNVLDMNENGWTISYRFIIEE